MDVKANNVYFDVPPFEPQESEQKRAKLEQYRALIDEIREVALREGRYIPLPTPRLMERADALFSQNAETVREALIAGSNAIDAATILKDYAAALSGSYNFAATPTDMALALKAIRPFRAYMIDRYGLYFTLLLNYGRYMNAAANYHHDVRDAETATAETKRAYVNDPVSLMDARAYVWLRERGQIAAEDFDGIDPAEVEAFAARMNDYAALAEYCTYYFVAKYALLATADELAEILPPPLNTQTAVQDYAETLANETKQRVDAYADKFADAYNADKPLAEREKIEAEAERPVKIHQNIGIVLSRPVAVSPKGQNVAYSLPVKKYITRYVSENPKYGNITEYTVQKVFEGVNLLPNYVHDAKHYNGQSTYRTNISDFAELCGYQDASQPEKLALYGGLLMLSNLYFVVDRPRRYVEYTKANGKTVRRQSGGLTAIRFITVRETGLESGELLIDVFPEALTGRPTYLTAETYKQLRTKAKGLNQSRFNYQILSKGHKLEQDLIDEVFGYADMLKNAEAEDDAANLRKVRDYVRKKRPNARKKLAQWFEDYAANGIIKYTYTTGADGPVYSWERLREPTAEELADVIQDPTVEAVPDEQ